MLLLFLSGNPRPINTNIEVILVKDPDDGHITSGAIFEAKISLNNTLMRTGKTVREALVEVASQGSTGAINTGDR